MKRIGISATWNARRAGGLYIGAKLDFPTRILYENGERRDVMMISIGLLVLTIRIELRSRKVEGYSFD